MAMLVMFVKFRGLGLNFLQVFDLCFFYRTQQRPWIVFVARVLRKQHYVVLIVKPRTTAPGTVNQPHGQPTNLLAITQFNPQLELTFIPTHSVHRKLYHHLL